MFCIYHEYYKGYFQTRGILNVWKIHPRDAKGFSNLDKLYSYLERMYKLNMIRPEDVSIRYNSSY